jgi:hypothetical protein
MDTLCIVLTSIILSNLFLPYNLDLILNSGKLFNLTLTNIMKSQIETSAIF